MIIELVTQIRVCLQIHAKSVLRDFVGTCLVGAELARDAVSGVFQIEIKARTQAYRGSIRVTSRSASLANEVIAQRQESISANGRRQYRRT